MTIPPDDVRELAQAVDRLVLWLRRSARPAYSSSTMAALDRLALDGPLRVSDLARRESVSQPGVTLLVNRAAGGGLVERVPDPTDGRASLVRITDAGRAVLARRADDRAAALEGRLADLDAADRRALARALPALARLVPSDVTPSVGTPESAARG